MTTETLAIETRNLDFSFSKNTPFIADLNLRVPKGSIYGFLGSNGAGKSTTIRLILGLLKSKGNISILGERLDKSAQLIYRKIGVLIENASLYEHLSAYDNLKIVAKLHGLEKSKIDEALKLVKLEYAANKLVKKFSLGMKQRLGIAIALLPNPELLILDEPINGLDPKGIKDIRELLIKLNKERGTTVFLSSHVLSEIEKTCTHVGVIEQGILKFQGSIAELRSHKSQKPYLLIETSEVEKAIDILNTEKKQTETVNENTIWVNIENKQDIPTLVNTLVKNDLEIFSVKHKTESLEEWFMQMTND